MSYDRMKTEETRLQKEIADILVEARAADDTDDLQHGPDRHGDRCLRS